MSRELSHHQQGIVRRYYEHHDAIIATRLAEIASDLALADEKAKARLWTRARQALAQTKLEPALIERIVGTRDLKLLAETAARLAKS